MASFVDFSYETMFAIGRAIDTVYEKATGAPTELSLYQGLQGGIACALIDSIKTDRSLPAHRVSGAYDDMGFRVVAQISPEGGPYFKIDRIDVELVPQEEIKQEAAAPESPRVFTAGGHSFRLSLEMREGMEGIKGADHEIDWATLKRCLNKKRKALQKIREAKEETFLDSYFRTKSGRVLNIVLKFFPEEKVPFVIWTAYYMDAGVIKSRFPRLKSPLMYENWYKSQPQSFKS